VDDDGIILRINYKMTEILGFEEAELTGRSIKVVFEEEENLKEKIFFEDITMPIEVKTNYFTKLGEKIPVEVTLSPIFDKKGYLMGTVVVAKDIRLTKRLESEIVERKKTELELIKSNEKLKELDKMKTDFLSVISHELRTPLTSILGFSKLMKKKVSKCITKNENYNEEFLNILSENLNIISLEAERLSNLINDVLDISKMEAGKSEWRLLPTSISEVLDRAVSTMSLTLEEKNIKLTIDIEEDLPNVMLDYDRILQVILNLLSNAAKFTDEGEIKISVITNNRNIIFTVKDSGIGIMQENLEEIFDKFKQVGDTLTNRPKGTGLGLPICRQIIEHHGGKIWVESVLGEGSSFIFTLPIDNKELEFRRINLENLIKTISSNVNNEEENSQKTTGDILIVDDDESIGVFLKEVLELENYSIRRSLNGVDAINEVRRKKPDLIILDVVMPHMNGFDVAAVLKNDPSSKDIPIIMLSVMEDKERGIILGVDRYLKKPVNVDELLSNIGKLIKDEKIEKKVLIVNDNMDTVKYLFDILEKKGFRTINYCKSEDFFSKNYQIMPEVLIIDAGVAKSIQNFHEFRAKDIFINTSIFILGEEGDKIEG
jgi:PAS domain S-box-containing protein